MQDILNEIVKTLVITSIGLAGPVVVGLVVQLFRKANLELSGVQQAELRDAVQNVLIEVEEWAAHRLKASIPVTSGQKMGKAVETLMDSHPRLTEADAEALVRQELPKLGLGASRTTPPDAEE